MDISQGCVNVLFCIQKVAPLPLQISPELAELSCRKEFFNKSKKFQGMLLWRCSMFTLLSISLLSLFYILQLFRDWWMGNNMEQICMYTLFFAFANLGFAVLRTMKSPEQLSFAATQSLKVSKFRTKGCPFNRRIPDFKEFLIYIFAGGLPMVEIMAITFPFFLDYHPVGLLAQLLFTSPLTTYVSLLSNIFGSFLYVLMIHLGGGNFMFLFLVTALFGESIQMASYKLWPKESNYLQNNSISNTSVSKMRVFSSTVGRFTECWKMYNILRILVHEGNSVAEVFLQTLLVMGCLLATSSGFVLTMLADRIPLAIYLAAAALLPLVIIAILILVTLAAIPRENANKFRLFWRERLPNKIDARRLRTCPLIGYSFGFIQNCQRCTALSIIDVILNSIASVVLL